MASSLYQIGGAWQVCAHPTERSHSHTTSAVSCQVCVHALRAQHLQTIFSTYDLGMVQHQEQVRWTKFWKLVTIYRFDRPEEDNR